MVVTMVMISLVMTTMVSDFSDGDADDDSMGHDPPLWVSCWVVMLLMIPLVTTTIDMILSVVKMM